MATRLVKPGTLGEIPTKPQYQTEDDPEERKEQKATKRKYGLSFNPADGKKRNYRVEVINYGRYLSFYKVVYDDISDHDGSKVIRVISKRTFKTREAAEKKVALLEQIQNKSSK